MTCQVCGASAAAWGDGQPGLTGTAQRGGAGGEWDLLLWL